MARVFTEDGILILPGDVFKKGRDEIRAFMAAAYAGPTGILAPGETEIVPELAVQSSSGAISAPVCGAGEGKDPRRGYGVRFGSAPSVHSKPGARGA